MVYFGILWYFPHIFLGFSIYQSIPKYTKVYHGIPPATPNHEYGAVYPRISLHFKGFPSLCLQCEGTAPYSRFGVAH